MRQLILIRHAKSSWKNPELDDFDRPLNKRGKRDVSFMSKLLSEKISKPYKLVSSPAERTKLTAILFAKELGIDKDDIIWNDKIYLASSEALIDLIREFDESTHSVILIGHNPGLTDLQNKLCKTEIDNIPTCGIVAMTTNKHWSKISSKDFLLDFFEYPKKYFR